MPAPANELLETGPKPKSMLKLDQRARGSTKQSTKPRIGRPELKTEDLRSRLTSFLPDLKAANDALPKDSGVLDIENVAEGSPYIEMDLGLGVLEERNGDDSSSGESEGSSHEEGNVLNKLMGRPTQKAASIIEIPPSANQERDAGLICVPVLQRYKRLCTPSTQFEMDIVLSLMSRILLQLRKHKATNSVDTITKLNVLREDMFKLMSRRDTLIESEDRRLKHESLYLNELDELLEE